MWSARVQAALRPCSTLPAQVQDPATAARSGCARSTAALTAAAAPAAAADRSRSSCASSGSCRCGPWISHRQACGCIASAAIAPSPLLSMTAWATALVMLQGVKWRMLPSAPYKVSPQQAGAFEFADLHSEDHDLRWALRSSPATARHLLSLKVMCKIPVKPSLHCLLSNVLVGNHRIFSFEKGMKGAREFIATTYDEFWGRYRRMDGGWHFYEIVREGWPCHLYFGAHSAAECCRPGPRRLACTCLCLSS